MPEPRVYSASVVGCGSGGSLSIDALARSGRFDLVAVCDVREDVRRSVEERHPGIRTYPNHQALLADSPTDVVCVSTYADTHGEIAHAAMETGLAGILVEKPLGDTTAAGSGIVAAAERRRLPLAVPHGLLARATSREVLNRVGRGDIGALRLVEIECSGWDILNAGIHWLQFFVTLLGDAPLEAVLATCDTSTRTYRDGLQVETESVTCAWTHDGVRVVMHCGDDVRMSRSGKATLFRIVGTDGLIEFWGWENGYRIVAVGEQPAERIEVPEFDVTPHQFHLENLAAQIDAAAPDYSVAHASLRALEVCEAAYLSSRERCVVPLPLDDAKVPERTDWDPGRVYTGTGGGRDGRRLEVAR